MLSSLEGTEFVAVVGTEGAIDLGRVIVLIGGRGSIDITTWLSCTSKGIEFGVVVGTEVVIDSSRIIEFTGIDKIDC